MTKQLAKLAIPRDMSSARHTAALTIMSIRYGRTGAACRGRRLFRRLAELTYRQANDARALGLTEDARDLDIIANAAWTIRY